MGSITAAVKRLSAPSVAIEITRPHDPANLAYGGPEPIILKAVPANFSHTKKRPGITYDPAFREMHYEWDMGMPGATFDVPERLLPAHRDANRARDQHVCRIYDPGTHTVQVAVTDYWGRTAYASITFTVNPYPAGYIPLIVSTSGTWTEAPAHNVDHRFASFDAAMNYAMTSGSNHRILCRAGEVFESEGFRLQSESANQNAWNMGRFMVGTYGGSARAIINVAQTAVAFMRVVGEAGKGIEYTFLENLDVRSTWDTTIESTAAGNVASMPAAFSIWVTGWLAVRNCLADGVGNGYDTYSASDSRPSYLVAQNCSARNFQNFGYYASAGDLSHFLIIGCEGIHSADALMNGVGKSLGERGMRNDHAALRSQRNALMIIESFSGHGKGQWAGNGAVLPPSPQPVLRIHQNDPISRILVSRSYIEGSVAWGNAIGGAPSTQRALNGRMSESIIVAASRKGGVFGNDSNGGVSLENCLVIRPDIASDAPWLPGSSIGMKGVPDLDRDSLESAVAILHCTVVNLVSDAHYSGAYVPIGGADGGVYFKRATFANNVVHTPNRADGLTSDGPFDLEALWSPVDRGYKIGVARGQWGAGLPAAVAPGGTVTIPYADLNQPAGWQAASYAQAMFTADPSRHRDHWIRFGGSDAASEEAASTGAIYTAVSGQIAVSFGASAITITNTSGVTWPAGTSLDFGFDHRTVPMTSIPSYNPVNGLPDGMVQLYRPAPGSGAYQDAGQWPRLPRDLLGRLRGPNPSRGCLEPLAA